MDNNYELVHHGIPGMKWGVRRYQNRDGSLTAAGKKRQKTVTVDEKKIDKRKPTKLKDLSDTELREKINRMELEKRYRDLSQSTEGRSALNRGKRFVADVVENSARNIGTQALTYAMGTALNKSVKKMLNIDVDIVNPKKGQKDK